MPRILLAVLALVIALIQALLFPWLNLFGGQIPFLLLALLLCSKKFSKQLPVMGAMGGLGLDLVSATPFGLWTLYYFCTGFILRLLLDKPSARWWWTLVWLSAAIGLNPLYAQAMSGQIDLVHWYHEIIWPTTIITIIAIWPSWMLRKPVERGI